MRLMHGLRGTGLQSHERDISIIGIRLICHRWIPSRRNGIESYLSCLTLKLMYIIYRNPFESDTTIITLTTLIQRSREMNTSMSDTPSEQDAPSGQ